MPGRQKPRHVWLLPPCDAGPDCLCTERPQRLRNPSVVCPRLFAQQAKESSGTYTVHNFQTEQPGRPERTGFNRFGTSGAPTRQCRQMAQNGRTLPLHRIFQPARRLALAAILKLSILNVRHMTGVSRLLASTFMRLHNLFQFSGLSNLTGAKEVFAKFQVKISNTTFCLPSSANIRMVF